MMKRLSNNKGQITIFIILGIVILFIVAISIYWQNSFNRVRPPVQQLIVDDQLKPIQVYVTDCLSAISKEALIRIGQNGGYITIPNGLHINLGKPYDSDALFFDPQVMPYWYYMRPCEQSSVGCIYINNPPVCKSGVECALPYRGQNSIEEQLSKYVQDNVGSCVNNFEPFKDVYDIRAGAIKVDTQITEQTVNFKMDYPLTINIKGSKSSGDIAYFYTEHKLKFKRIYQFAQEVRDAEANYTFLERNTLNLISVYSGIDSKQMPPMSDMDMFVKGKKYWIRTDVKEHLMNEILPYTMLLQLVNAGNAQDILPRGTNSKYISFEEGFYKGMMIKVSENSYSDLDANVYYPPGADIYLNIGGSEIIKPKNYDGGDNIIMKMMSFAFNDYSFKYDISYPVIVSIRDPEAFNGEGYTFNYAVQANIRQNVPITQNMTVVSISNVPSIDLEDTDLRTDRMITIEAYDKYTKEPLEDVLVSYKCGYDILIGSTAMKAGKAILSDKFPFCEVGGTIVYEREGYMSGVIDYTNVAGSDSKNFRVELWPLKEKKLKVYKRTQANINSIRSVGAGGIVFYSTAYTELGPEDTVYLNVYRTKDDPRESDVPLIGFVSVRSSNATPPKLITKQDQIDFVNKAYNDGLINVSARDAMLTDLNFVSDEPTIVEATSAEEYVMEFVPGTYTLDAFMMYDGLITIPAKSEEVCAGAEVMNVCVFGKSTIDFPEQNFTSWVSGGANLDFVLTENDVYNDDTLIFFVAEMPLPSDWSMLQESLSIESYQNNMLPFLRPTVRRE
jgi:hypothetical protein